MYQKITLRKKKKKRLKKYLPTRKSHSTCLYFVRLISSLQSTTWVQEKNLSLCLQILKPHASPKDCYKSSIIPICRSTEIPEKRLLQKPGRAWGYLYVWAVITCSPTLLLQHSRCEPSFTAHAKWIPTSAIALGMKTSFQVSHAAKSSGLLSCLFRRAQPNH